MSRRVFVTGSESGTAGLGAALGRMAGPGTVILLDGELGAGKTAFVRGLARGLGAPDDEVSSPTFTLVQEYRGGRMPLFHADLYRLEGGDADDLGLDELGGEAVVAVEWGAKLRRQPAEAVRVLIEDLGDDRRRVTIDGPDTLLPAASVGPPERTD